MVYRAATIAQTARCANIRNSLATVTRALRIAPPLRTVGLRLFAGVDKLRISHYNYLPIIAPIIVARIDRHNAQSRTYQSNRHSTRSSPNGEWC
jgi:hypothetical protein